MPKCKKCGEIIKKRPFYCNTCNEYKKDDDLKFQLGELDIELITRIESLFKK